MSKSPSYQFYPKDILSSARVAMMDLKTEGAYRRALDLCWLNGTIPADEVKLSRMIGKGCTKQIASEVKQMFVEHPEDPSLLIHERLEEERHKQKENKRRRSEAGKKGNEARYGKGHDESEQDKKPVANEVALRSQTDSKYPSKEVAKSRLSSSIAIAISTDVDNTPLPPEGEYAGGIEKKIMAAFGLSEQKHPANYMLVMNACSMIYAAGKMPHFENQVNNYLAYKTMANEKVHMFRNFIGHESNGFMTGAWNAENWKEKIEKLKQQENAKSNSAVGRHPQTGRKNLDSGSEGKDYYAGLPGTAGKV